MFKMHIETDNDAFVENRTATLAWMLGEVIGRMSYGEREGNIRDMNGNTVGSFELTEETTSESDMTSGDFVRIFGPSVGAKDDY